MNLTEPALKAIDNKNTRLRLAMALNVTEQTIIKYISVNHENLTKAAAMKVIKADTGLRENQILESAIA
jgi:hypothetical protein